MFAAVKAQAAAAALAAKDTAAAAALAAKDRVETGLAGKKLLDEGGPEMEAKLLAKKASLDATSKQQNLLIVLQLAIESYHQSAEKVAQAHQFAAGETPAFDKLGKDYAEREKALTGSLRKLTEAVALQPATVSAAENDAITILTTKLKAIGLKQTVGGHVERAGGELQRMSQSTGSKETPDAEGQEAPLTNDRDLPPAEEPGKAKSSVGDKMNAAYDAGKQRVSVATTGKKIVDESTPEIQAKLLAKKSAIEATGRDQNVLDGLTQAVEMFDDAAAKLKTAEASAAGEEPSFNSLSQAYALRSTLIKSVLEGLPPKPENANVSPEEKDAISILTAQLMASGAKEKAVTTGQAAQRAVTGGKGGYSSEPK